MTQVWSEEVQTSRWTTRGTKGGGIREYFREYFMELKVFRWTQEWLGVVSAEAEREYMTL